MKRKRKDRGEMDFATTAAFVVAATVLCLGERGIRVRLALRDGTGPRCRRWEHSFAASVKLLSRRRADHKSSAGAGPRVCVLIGGALLALASVPFGRDLQLLPPSTGVLVSLAALAIALVGYPLSSIPHAGRPRNAVHFAGRSVVVFVSLGFLVVGVVLIPGTAGLAGIVEAQPSVVDWLAWRQPIGLLLSAAILLLAFDQEPALNPFPPAEHRGNRAALHAVGAALTRVFLAALVVSLYLGGWSPGLSLPDGWWWKLLTALVFVVKTLLVLCALHLGARYLPRYRSDQAQRLAWTILLPCAVANVFLTAACASLYRWFVSSPGQLGAP